MWVRVRDAIAGALDSMTLADLVPSAARLNRAGVPALSAQSDRASSSKASTLTLAD